jgi:hypothetical protein
LSSRPSQPLHGHTGGGGGYAYVDPKTYYPVEIRSGNITRFSTYEYLPRTAANLALTNIRAQHPHARLTARG